MPLPTTALVSTPRAFGYGVRFDDKLFRMLVTPETPFDWEHVETQAPQLNTNENPEDFSPTVGRRFSRSEFYGGEGLAFAHRPNNDENDKARFWDSLGLEVANRIPGSPPSVSLLKQATQVWSGDFTKLVKTSNDFIWYPLDPELDGTYNEVKRIEDPLDNWSFGTQELPGAGAITDIAVLNDLPHIATATGVFRRTTNTSVGAWNSWSNLIASKIWSVKERLVAAGEGVNSHILYEVRSGAGSVEIHQLADNYTWVGICEFSGGLLGIATDGNIYMFTFDTDEETFDLSLFSRTKLEGEIPSAIFSLYDTVLLATYTQVESGYISRIYSANISDFTLNLDLKRQWGDTSTTNDYRIYTIYASGHFFYFGITEKDKSRAHVWKYDITNEAIYRSVGHTVNITSDPTTWAIESIVLTRDKITYGFKGVHGELTTTTRRESPTTPVATGYIILPLIDFYSSSDKVWVSSEIDATLPTSSTTIQLYYSTDPDAILDSNHASWTLLTTWNNTTNLPEDGEVRIPEANSRYLAIKLVLNSAGTVDAEVPELRSFAVRAYAGETDIRLNIPINVSDVISIPGRRRVRTKGLGRQLHNELKLLQGQDVETQVYEPDITVMGTVEKVSKRVTRVYYRGSSLSVAYVTVVGKRVS